MKKRKYFTVYKITNKINNFIYIGIHITKDLNDGYMGSGTAIKKAIKKYGKYNFKKEYLFIFDNEKDMNNKEKELVNENFCKRKDTYNLSLGGGYPKLISGTVTVKDKQGKFFRVSVDDPRYLSGELVHNIKGLVVVKDKLNNIHCVPKNDPRYLSGELRSITKGMFTAKDKNGNFYHILKDDPRYLSGELVGVSKGRKGLKTFFGKKHTKETKQKMSLVRKGCYKGPENPSWGTCWIYNLEQQKNLRINKNELQKYLSQGWTKGRKIKF